VKHLQFSKKYIFIIFFSISSLFFSSYTIAQKKEASSSEELEIPIEDIQRFTTVIAQVKNHYVEPIEDEKLFTNAIRGLLSNLDPHSRYMGSDELKNLNVEMSGELVGIGVELTSDDKGDIRVIAPLDGSPAEAAGVKPGDIILKIDKQVVNNMSLEEAGSKIRGKKGTKVHLELVRPGTRKLIKLNIPRKVVKLDYVKSQLLDQNYAYIRVPRFHKTAAADIKKVIQDLQKQSSHHCLKGVILDLRNNTGGLLTSAVDVSNLFLDSKPLKKNKKIVYTKKRGDQTGFEAKIKGGDILKGLPMVVLLNKGSASSSEIVAGALQDHQRAVILGEKSFGKGSVQTILPVDENSAISLTTELYYTPLGKAIQAKGIKPDVEVEEVKFSKNKRRRGWFFLP
jgi:carboxyl-terminal processing protease